MKAHPFVAALAKHLPPSASSLRLLDIDGRCCAGLQELRKDLDIIACGVEQLPFAAISLASLDAVVAFEVALADELLATVMDLLRPGGRFVAVDSRATVDDSQLRALEAHGYIRILIEPAVDGAGVLMRGEKAHTTSDTHERIRVAADADPDRLDLTTYRKPYLHLLIRQSPNKPVWQLRADEPISWHAAALLSQSQTTLLAFSSLPKAVAFIQPIALDGADLRINKVAKFARDSAAELGHPLLLNPTPESVSLVRLTWLPVDPALAEAPDE